LRESLVDLARGEHRFSIHVDGDVEAGLARSVRVYFDQLSSSARSGSCLTRRSPSDEIEPNGGAGRT
jgi:hypothetical protein